ncbi:D-amino-acid dehydrogenase [Streptomyces griseochromogenes]|nr:FAD-dependent oxidoreductase [Streptomyces griseochromogenes]MBP2047735.1 D-amino-acid dehydrogenase [Streptomyces griseochromogenes]
MPGDRVLFQPELDTADDTTVAASLCEVRPHVIISATTPSSAVLRAWRDAMGAEPIAVVRIGPSRQPEKRGLPSMEAEPQHARLPFDVPLFSVSGPSSGAGAPADPEEAVLFRALAIAERFVQEHRAKRDRATAVAPRSDGERESVLVVGAGVVNLVTAHTLLTNGYRVTLMDAGPDPRENRPWNHYGCSRGGGNARMFTLTEMDDYHPRHTDDADSNLVFDRSPEQLGWDIRRDPAAVAGDQAWVQDFKSPPRWLTHAYNHDIFGLNRRSGDLWKEWMKEQPHIFDGLHVRHDILRLYQDEADLAASRHRQDAIGATLALFGPDAVRERFPALARARHDAFAGAIMVRGFTLDVHRFMTELVDLLEAGGAELRFGQRAERILRDSADVTGVLTESGVFHRDHYVFSPGVDGGTLLGDTGLAGQVHGVLGCWTTIPNTTQPLQNSLKVARRGHIAADANVTVGEDESGRPALMIGSGYGWTGADPRNIDERKLESIHAAVADTVELLFPDIYQSIGGREGLRRTEKYCVRPWTASNLGIFQTARAVSGAFVVTGGHNTGGFAQSPVIAEAVLHALRGRHHPMHTLYHPSRMRRALGAVPDSLPA